MRRFILSLWRSAVLIFWVMIGFLALCVFLIGASILQVYQQFGGNAVLPADCALVFGAAVYNGYPGPAIVRRVSTAADLYKNHQVHKLILSGGRGEAGQVSEASVMKQQAMQLGVLSADITVEEASHSTEENLLNSRNLTLKCSSVVGISDAYHLARIELLARRQGWTDLQTLPATIRPQEASERNSVLREAFAYLYYDFYFDHWISSSALEKRFSDIPQKGFIPEKSQ